MKKLIYFFSLLLFFSCKEEELQPNVNLESPFVIKDDINDPVQHKRFLIYKEYGIPVFFSDTLDRIFITTNVYGDSIYDHETLDLNWAFNTVGSIKYKFTYITNPSDQLNALDKVDAYLKVATKSLLPFSIFLVKDFEAEGHNEIISVITGSDGKTLKTANTYRTMLMSNMQTIFEENLLTELNSRLVQNLVKKNLVLDAYKAKYLDFQTVTNATHYDKNWTTFSIDETNFTPIMWRSFDYNKTYTNLDSIAKFNKIISVIGQYGFINVSANLSGRYSPAKQFDMNNYVDAIFKYNSRTFERVWGSSPLVMKKYDKMRDIIINDMEIPLDEIVK